MNENKRFIYDKNLEFEDSGLADKKELEETESQYSVKEACEMLNQLNDEKIKLENENKELKKFKKEIIKNEDEIDRENRFSFAYGENGGESWAVRDGYITLFRGEVIGMLNMYDKENVMLKQLISHYRESFRMTQDLCEWVDKTLANENKLTSAEKKMLNEIVMIMF